MKHSILTVLITLLLSYTIQAQNTTADYNNEPYIFAPNNDSYAMTYRGAVYIGPTNDHPTNTKRDFPTAEAIEDVLLFVENGIATEDLTFIFPENWDEWPDYVFDKDYDLTDLDELDTYITKNKHLPGVITQEEVKNTGIVSGRQMHITLLEKIEELTLYTIKQHKALKAQESLNIELMKRLELLESKTNNK